MSKFATPTPEEGKDIHSGVGSVVAAGAGAPLKL